MILKMKLFYAGTFDPFTIGHQNVVNRALKMGFEVVVAIGVNSEKNPSGSVADRLGAIRKVFAGVSGVQVMSYDGLTAKAAVRAGAIALLRGVRNVTDFEAEKEIAAVNKAINGIETFMLLSEPSLEHVSSTIVRELASYGIDTSELIAK